MAKKRFRSAVTGRFVTAKEAARKARTTVGETIKTVARRGKK